LSEGEESNQKLFFFAASREKNLLSKSAPNGGCTPNPRMTDQPLRRILFRAPAETGALFATIN